MENNRWTDGLTTKLDTTEKRPEDGKRLALKAIASRIPINEIPLGRKDESDADRDAVRSEARQEVARIGNFTIVEQSESEVDVNSPQAVTVEQGEQEKRELSPEQAGRTLGALRSRFQANMELHGGMSWDDVEASLKASPEGLWSLAQMESAGHAPSIYHDNENEYYFGTCSAETPGSARNCVYDKEAADWLKKNAPQTVFNGSAVEMAEAMGITLMLPEHYRDILQKKGKFDKNTWSWLLTQSDIRSSGGALSGYRSDVGVYVHQNRARGHYDYGAWRGSLRVKKVKV